MIIKLKQDINIIIDGYYGTGTLGHAKAVLGIKIRLLVIALLSPQKK